MLPTPLLEEIKARQKRKQFSLETFLFKEQLAFVKDPSKAKTAVCSRRSGKTVACAADLLWTCLSNNNITCLYITLSRSNAKRIIWSELKKINRDYNLNAIPNESDLSMEFQNGSMLYCSGASDRTEIEKFRGLALKKVYLDESQSFPSFIKELIDDVLSPCLIDYAGTLCLIGTPGPVPAGYFHECSHSPDWSHHEWTFFTNPYISEKSGLTHQQILEGELKKRGVEVTHPSIQREYFGRWALDSDNLVYHYDKNKNDFSEILPANYTYIMGVDFGFEDADAIAVLAWSEKSPNTYLADEVVIKKEDITALINNVEILRKKYNVTKIVADFGGLGKKISEEIIRRWKIPMVAADKAQKHAAIEIMNDALRRGHFKAKSNSRFANDAMLLEWDRDKSTPEKRVVSNRFHSDILDAALYAFRESPAFTWTPEPIKPKWGTPEWAKQEVEDMERQAEQHFAELEEQKSIWDDSSF